MKELCTIILVYFSAIVISNPTPVFIYEDGNLDTVLKSELDPFVVVKRKEFDKIMRRIEVLSGTIIFFLEENFSLEDVTAKDCEGTAFPYSREQFLKNKLKIFLQVIDPYGYIKNRYPSFDQNTFKVGHSKANLQLKERQKYIFVLFVDNVNETRTQRYRRHEKLIQEVVQQVKKISERPVNSVFTGKRSFSEMSEDMHTDIDTKNYYYKNATQQSTEIIRFDCYNGSFQFIDLILTKDHELLPVKPSFCFFIAPSDSEWRYDLRFESHINGHTEMYSLQFTFRQLNSKDKTLGWMATEVSYSTSNGSKLSVQKLYHKSNWSTWYTSSKPLLMRSRDPLHPDLEIGVYKIFLSDKLVTGQMEDMPVLRTGTSQPKQGVRTITEVTERPRYMAPWWDSDDSQMVKITEEPVETLATPGILMGLLVFCLIFFVYLWGLSYMMSLNTNSRYDNQDSKPLFDPETIKD